MKQTQKNNCPKFGIIFLKGTKNFIVLLITILLLGACSKDNNSVAPEIEQEPVEETPKEPLEAESFLDVSYGDTSDQVFDIYLPKDRSLDTKLLVLVHGGGWSSGDKADMNGFKDFVIQELPELAVVNINYRLADENNLPYPMQTDDISSVVNFLKANKEEYHIGDDLGFVGISAGAHLSLLWAYALDTEQKVNMVCSIVGPTNLLDPAYQNTDDETVKELIAQFGLNNEILEEASPLQKLSGGAPPTILFYGGQDPLIPVSQGVDLDSKLSELGIEHEFTLYETEGHGWVGLNLFDTSLKLKAFIEKHL